MSVYFFRHLQVLFDTLGRMIRSPMPTFMAVMVLAIAITLPLLLFKLAQSTDGVGAQWQGKPQISLFLNITGEQADRAALALGDELLENKRIQSIEYISPLEALMEFREKSEFGDILNDLPGNPLPPLLIVYPSESLSDSQLENLVQGLKERPEVDVVSYDREWIQRLAALINLFKQLLYVLSILMGLGIVLIIGNTVHLGILSRKDEIYIVDQIGGTRAFIRRPFLYFGVLQGLAGALVALLITNVSIWIISHPINELAQLYETDLHVDWVGVRATASVFVISGLLGWLAARITVGSYLKQLGINEHGR